MMRSTLAISACILFATATASLLAQKTSLQNPDFSQGDGTPDGWKIPDNPPAYVRMARDTATFKTAPASLRIDIVGGAGTATVLQGMPDVPLSSFDFSGFYKTSGPAEQIKYDFQCFNANYSKQIAWITSDDNDASKLHPSTEWREFSRHIELPSETVHAVLYLNVTGADGAKAWFDGLRVVLPAKVSHVPQADRTKVGTSAPVTITGQEPYLWSNAVMGGVEYATGVVWCLRQPEHLYIRADGGGIWKLDRATSNRWINLSDNIPYKWSSLVTADSLAVDPDDPNTIYVAGGGRWGNLHDVLKTTDGGKTWSRTNCRTPEGNPVMSDGNGDNKQVGERLMVDPNSPNILYFATRNDGLMVSRDKAATWQRIDSFTERGKDWAGVSFVVMDYQRGKTGEPSRRIYVGVQPGDRDGKRAEGGIFLSEDAAATWRKLEGGPAPMATPMRARIAPDGTFYVTVVGTGDWNNPGDSGGGVWRLRNGKWDDITPPNGHGRPFCGINFHPSDPNQIVVAQTYGQFDQVFHYTRDAGKTWLDYRNLRENPEQSNVRIRTFVPWEKGEQPGWGGNAADIAFDPIRPEWVWHMSFSGPCRITGIGQPEAIVDLVGDGREQMTCGDVVSPSKGAPLISGVWDVGGFRHEKLDQIPERVIPLIPRDGKGNWGEKQWQDCFQIDVNPSTPDRLVSCGGWQWNMTGDACYSNDNARTWIEFPTKPFSGAKFGRIAIGSNPDNVIWAPMGDKQSPPYVTHDNGKTWKVCQGAPLGMVATDGPWSFYKLLAADRVKPNTFYIYDRRDGRFYRSDDAGGTFAHVARLPAQQGVHFDNNRVLTNPYIAGDVWVSIQEHGLFHSSDAGVTWQKLDGVRWANNFGFGKAKDGSKVPSIFLFGQLGGDAPDAQGLNLNVQLYRSDDLGATWVQINDEAHQLATIAAGFCGDMQTWGRVYVSTGSRGVFYAQPKSAK